MQRHRSRLTLKTTPQDRLSLGTWQMPCVDGLSNDQKRKFFALKDAVSHYVNGGAVCRLLDTMSISREQFYRAFDKCVSLDGRGKPLGWAGLLPYQEIAPRQRRAPLGGKGNRGLAGALQFLLRQNSDIAEALEEYILRNAMRKKGGEAGVRHKSVHMEFLRLCEAKDPEQQCWPFTSRRQGAGAIRDYVESYLTRNYDKIVATTYGSKAATKSKAGNGHVSRLIACMPLDIVEIDEHAAGFIGTVRIDTPEGHRYVDAGRVTLLLMADRLKGWILGFKVIYREAANSGDVMDVLHAAMVGEPGFAHRKGEQPGACPLVDLDGRFSWCGFNCLLLDNALIHLVDELVSRVMGLAGCAVNFGPVATPARRQLAESIFNALERSGFKRLPATTGSGPQDPKRQDPEAAARNCMLTGSDIIELVADLVRKFNNDIGKKNLAASPQQRMESIICGEEKGRYLFPFLPPLREGEADLSKLIVTVPIKGERKTGRRPYFTYLEADYTSTDLAKSWDLLGHSATLHVARSNVRLIEAHANRRFLGVCCASGRWRWSDHSIDLRRTINQLVREGYIRNDRGDDVVAAFLKKVASDHAASMRGQKPSKSLVRQYGDHAVRRDVPDERMSSEAQANGSEQLVSDLLDRASEPVQTTYLEWDDIPAFNGGGHDY